MYITPRDKNKNITPQVTPDSFPLWKKIAGGVAFVLVVLGVAWWIAIQPPRNVDNDTTVHIPKGANVRDVGHVLEKKNLIRVPGLFTLLVTLIDSHVVAGDYRFQHPPLLLEVVHRLSKGIHGNVEIKVTFPEGSTREDMAEAIAKKLPRVTKSQFMQTTKGKEGRLYPDTYFFFPSSTVDDVVKRLTQNFSRHVKDVLSQVEQSPHTLEEILIMASIVEREANKDHKEERTIAGILWKRLDTGMPLQVDAPFAYTIGKGSSGLTHADLASDSAYNTYVNRGLPPTPISSPDIDTIKATLDPIDTPYFFYLHGENGKVYYARTYEEHLINRRNYIE